MVALFNRLVSETPVPGADWGLFAWRTPIDCMTDVVLEAPAGAVLANGLALGPDCFPFPVAGLDSVAYQLTGAAPSYQLVLSEAPRAALFAALRDAQLPVCFGPHVVRDGLLTHSAAALLPPSLLSSPVPRAG